MGKDEWQVAIAGMMWLSWFLITPAMTNVTTSTAAPDKFMQRWSAVQHELIPEIRAAVGVLTPKLEKLRKP